MTADPTAPVDVPMSRGDAIRHVITTTWTAYFACSADERDTLTRRALRALGVTDAEIDAP